MTNKKQISPTGGASFESVHKRSIGSTDLWVSPVAFGGWPIAGMTSLDVNDDDSLATVEHAIACGINFIDTAHCYGANGESENLIGKAIRGKRNDLILASKAGIHWDADSVRHFDGRPQTILDEFDESLRRMGVDMIDLFYLHAPDPEVSVADSATAFAELLSAGKIRAAGVSNFNLSQLEQFHSVCPISAVQPPFNMLQRAIESDIVPWCRQRNISIVNYWPLMKGLLAGKIRRGHTFSPDDNRLKYEIFQGTQFESAQKLLDGLDTIASEINKTVAQIVVNWTFHQPGITSTLCGAKRAWQIEETAGAMGWELSPQHQSKIQSLIDDCEQH